MTEPRIQQTLKQRIWLKALAFVAPIAPKQFLKRSLTAWFDDVGDERLIALNRISRLIGNEAAAGNQHSVDALARQGTALAQKYMRELDA